MGERHDAEREIAQARERLSELTEELSRRASGPYVKERAREFADETIERAKFKARERTYEMRDRFLESPWALGLIGGTIGAIAGKMIGEVTKKRFSGRDEGWDQRYLAYGNVDRPYDEYNATHESAGLNSGSYGAERSIITDDSMYGLDQTYGARSEGEIGRVGFEGEVYTGKDDGMKAKAQEKLGAIKHGVADKASSVKHGIADTASSIKHGVSDTASRAKDKLHDVREHLPNMRHAIPSKEQLRSGGRAVVRSTEEHSNLWALGALAVGAFFGAMVPVSQKERAMMRPAKDQLKAQLGDIKDEAISTAKNIKENVEQTLVHKGEDDQEKSWEEEESTGYASNLPSSDPSPSWSAADDSNDAGYGQPGLVSAPGSFSTGGIESPSPSLESNREESREAGVWTPGYNPDVTKH